MKAKEYLNQYKKIIARIVLLERDIEQLEAGIGASLIGDDKDMPRPPGTRNTAEDRLLNLIDMKRDKENLLMEARVKAAEISGVIEELALINDQNAEAYMKLLYDRYILLMTWNEVAEDIKFTLDYTRGRLHGKALMALNNILKETTQNHIAGC